PGGGFAGLVALDGNADGVIDANDTAFAQLRVWGDTNGDGVTQPGELMTLADLGVRSIGVTATAVTGGPITAVGSLTFTDGATEAIDDLALPTRAPPARLDGRDPAAW